MKDKLSVFDRRTEILSRLFWEKIITMRELAIEFDVSEDTIGRDIVYLSRYATIETQRGVGGGVFIREEHKNLYTKLSGKEINLLQRLYEMTENEDREIMKSVLRKIAMTIYE